MHSRSGVAKSGDGCAVPLGRRIGNLMFERFTNNARNVMRLANQNARRLNHKSVRTEHMLLALAEHGAGVAVTVLTAMAIDLSQILSVVRSIVQEGSDAVSKHRLPQTPGAKQVIEFAMEEARSFGHRYVGTEHLLLGMLREDHGVAAHVLAELRVDLETIRTKVIEFLDCPEYQARNKAFARQADTTGSVSAIFSLVVLFVVLAAVITIVLWLG